MQRTIKRHATALLALVMMVGVLTAAIPLNASAAITITENPEIFTTGAGGNASFTAKANSNTDTLDYSWQVSTNLGGEYKDIQPNEHYSLTNWQTLEIANITQSMNGYVYRCVFRERNSGATETSIGGLLLVTPDGPKITKQPESITVAIGNSATFSVTVSGGAAPYKYQWQQDGGGGTWSDLPNWPGYIEGATSTSLNLLSVVPASNGNTIRCKVTDSQGRMIISNVLTLTVTDTGLIRALALTVTAPVDGAYPNFTAFPDDPVKYVVTSMTWHEGGSPGSPGPTMHSSDKFFYGKTYLAIVSLRANSGFGFPENENEITATINGLPARRSSWSGGGTNAVFYVSFSLDEWVNVEDQAGALVAGRDGTTTFRVATADIADGQTGTVKWFSDDSGITAGSAPAGITATVSPVASNSSLVTMTATAAATKGTYYFRVTISGATSDPATLTVSDPGGMLNFKPSRTYTLGQFTDVDENQWYGAGPTGQKFIKTAFEYALVNGMSGTTFGPNSDFTVEMAIALAARVHCIYHTGVDSIKQGEGANWSKPFIDYALDEANKIILPGDFPNINRPATRAEMAYIFANCLPADEFKSQNTVIKLPDVNTSTPYYRSIIMLYEAGVVKGDDNSAFEPNSNMSRATAAGIITNIIIPAERVKGKIYD